MKHLRRIAVTTAGAAIVIAALVASGRVASLRTPAATPAATQSAGMSSAAGKSRPTPPVPATTTTVRRESVPLTQSGVGNVVTIASVTVRARVDGQLESVDFKEGQDVKAGQVLARIDPRTYQAQLAQVQAQKAKDEALLANARMDLSRYTELIKEDATSQQTLDTQKALVRQLEATLKTDDAQINFARVQLDYTTIIAPISGRVGARLVDPGNIVHATDANGLLVINQIDPIAVQFTLPESSFQALNRALHQGGDPLKVEAVARGDGEVLGAGTLALLNNQIDPTTGTVMLKGHFSNADHKLWPGQSVYGRITLGERPDALTVPSSVVQRSQDGLFAYVVKPDQSVQVQPIEIADSRDGRTVVLKGLTEGERVVVDGQFKLKPGVRIVEAPSSAAPAPQSGTPGGRGGAASGSGDAARDSGNAASGSGAATVTAANGAGS